MVTNRETETEKGRGGRKGGRVGGGKRKEKKERLKKEKGGEGRKEDMVKSD